MLEIQPAQPYMYAPRLSMSMQAPNVSLQQLIASFAAQSKQLGLGPVQQPVAPPSPGNSTLNKDSGIIPGLAEHLDCSTSARSESFTLPLHTATDRADLHVLSLL